MQVISLAASRGWPMSNSLSQIPLLKSVDETTLRSFEGRVNWAKFEENELVIDYDDNSNDVYFIVSGQVRVLYRTITGKEVILGEMGAGQFFGELSAIDGVGRSANVTALNRSQMCIMSGPVFMDLVTRTPAVCKQIMTILASRIRFLNTRLAEHSFLQTKHRLYAELIRLSQPRAGHSGQRVVSPPPFHHDLAARIGCRREAVSRELSALEKEGLVAKSRGALVLLNPDELNKRISAALSD
jgi:CRP/FNR family cyclic AMP-dependent transcriptional regulator